MSQELKPCPFCGAGETQIKENGRMWLGQCYSDPVSVSVRHWCAPADGQPSRMIERIGRDEASAVSAWNTRIIPPETTQLPVIAAGQVIDKSAAKRIATLLGWHPKPVAVPPGWRGIESAPKDGTPVIAVVYGFQPTIAEFSEAIGWHYCDEMGNCDEYAPTHWMPLPAWDAHTIDAAMLAAAPKPEQPMRALTDIVWPEGYCLDPHGKMTCPAGKADDFNFGYEIGFRESMRIKASAAKASKKRGLTDEEVKEMALAGGFIDCAFDLPDGYWAQAREMQRIFCRFARAIEAKMKGEQ